MSEPSDIERVRLRPGMYVGDTTNGTGLHNMVYELVCNAVNEVLHGYATEILVRMNADSSCTVHDDGRGLPTELDQKLGMSKAEAIMTHMIAGIGDSRCRGVVGRLHGVGACVVNALSDWLVLRIWRDGKETRFRFRNGCREGSPTTVADVRNRHGTEITFLPASGFFSNTRFDFANLQIRFGKLSADNAIPQIKLIDARSI